MLEIINILINENYKGIRNILREHASNEVVVDLVNAIDGKTTLNSKVVYKLLYLLNDDHGLCDVIFNHLKNGYYENKINDFLFIIDVFRRLHEPKIFTDIRIIREQIQDYEKLYNWGINDKFLFPCNNSGLYAVMVIFKLMNSDNLIKEIPDEYERYKHIIENQIFVVEEEAINNFYFAITVDVNNEFKKNIFTGNFTTFKSDGYFRKLNINFTASFGEAPVDTKTHIKRSRNYIYHKYINKSINLCKVTNILSPSRWFQTDSSELGYLKKFRENMIKSNHIRLLNYFDIKNDYTNTGGISYMIYDNEYLGDCFFKKDNLTIDLKVSDVILKNANYYSLINKLKSGNMITSLFFSNSWSNIKSNDLRLKEKTKDNDIKVYTNKKHGYIKWVNNNIEIPYGSDMWKILIKETISTGIGTDNEYILAKPGELCTESYCLFIINSEKQAKSLLSYLQTEFVNKIILIRKIKNHINEHCLSYVPLVPLDRKWSDEKLVNYLELSSQEKNIIYG